MLCFIHLALAGRRMGWDESKLTFEAARVMSAEKHEEARALKSRSKSGFEPNLTTFMPRCTAYEMRPLAKRYVRDDMTPEQGDRERLTTLLGRPLHGYQEIAARIATAA